MEDLAQALIVHTLLGPHIVAEAPNSWEQHTLGPLGFHPAPHLGPHHWVRPVENETERLYLTRELLGWGALFAEGTGWSPNEVLEQWHEEGKIDFAWRSLYWTGPGQPHIRALPRPALIKSPASPTPTDDLGCPTCRDRMRHPQNAHLSLGSSAYRYANLYCSTLCNTWWEAGDRFAHPLTPTQAAEFYPAAFNSFQP